VNYAWPVVFSALFGAGIGAVFAYSNAEFFVSKARSAILLGVVIFSIPFTIYFSIYKSPIFTLFFYFLPVFGVVFYYVSSLLIEQTAENQNAAHFRFLEESSRTLQKKSMEVDLVQKEMSLDELLAEQQRREQAKKHRSHIENVSDDELHARITAMRNKNR